MERVTGIGGVFLKARDPSSLREWYRRNLGIEVEAYGGHAFLWRDGAAAEGGGSTTWAVFPAETPYFDPSPAGFMVNYRVRNLDAMLAQLRAAGVTVLDEVEEHEYGRFGWAMDPEGNKVELWEPRGDA